MAQVQYNGRPEDYDYLVESGYDFDMQKYLSRGWDLFKQYPVGFISFSVLSAIIILFVSVMPLVSIIAAGVQYCLYAGIYIVARKIARNEAYSYGDFFGGFDHFLQMFIAGLLVSIFTVVGIFLLVIPGIYLAIAYAMVVPLIVFGKLEGWSAMEVSRKVVSKNWWKYFAFFMLLGLGIGGICGIAAILIGMGVESETWASVILGGGILTVAILAGLPLMNTITYAVYEDIFDHDVETELLEEIGRDGEDEGESF